MSTTEYLFGYVKEKYYGVEFPQIGYDRISDGRELMNKLYKDISYDPTKQDTAQMNLQIRMRKIQDALTTWKKILEIEEN